MATEQELLDISKNYAEKAGFMLNPNKQIQDSVIKGLVRNEAKHGFRYCPCRIVTGNKEKDRKIICPCAFHKEEISAQGYCHCMLFFKKE